MTFQLYTQGIQVDDSGTEAPPEDIFIAKLRCLVEEAVVPNTGGRAVVSRCLMAKWNTIEGPVEVAVVSPQWFEVTTRMKGDEKWKRASSGRNVNP